MSPEHEHEGRSSESVHGSIRPDLEPIYELSEAQYVRIINQLANLLLATLRSLEAQGVSDLAGHVAGRASAILADYDPDVADVVGRAASR